MDVFYIGARERERAQQVESGWELGRRVQGVGERNKTHAHDTVVGGPFKARDPITSFSTQILIFVNRDQNFRFFLFVVVSNSA